MDRVDILKILGKELDSQLAMSPPVGFHSSSQVIRDRLSSAYLRLAKDLVKLGAGEESLASCRKALLANPDNLDASYFLLMRLEKINRVDEAWSELLSIENRHPAPYDACRKLSFIKACLEFRRGHLDTTRVILEEFIEKNRGIPLCTMAYSWLGKTLDRLGLYDEAMKAVTRYNNLAAATSEVQEMMKNNTWLDDVETSLCWYRDKTTFPWKATSLCGSEISPILLVGFPRSGTTLLEQILNSHSKVKAIEERPTMEGIQERFYGSEDKLWNLQTLTAHDAGTCRKAYWTNVARYVEGSPDDQMRVVDKFPLNILHLDLYARIFPKIKVIVSLRDPRDSVLSNYFQAYNLNPAMMNNLSLVSSARHYARVMEMYQVFRRFIPENIYEIRYEDIVGDFRNECSKLLDFLELEWEDGLERYYETASQRWIRTPSYDQVTKPLYGDSIGRWKNYAHHLEDVDPILRPFVETFGYHT
jgi:tetratricopeptide (TPR) repeat protein